MANFQIKLGQQANLPAKATEGTMYVTSDTKKVYVGIGTDNAPVQLSNDLIILANEAAFSSLTVKPQDVLYYISNVNVLAKYDGTNLIQINSAGLTTVSVTGEGNVITAAEVTANAKGELILTLTKGITAATNSELTTLAGRVTTAEGKLNTIQGDASTAGSIAKAQADAISTVVGTGSDAKTADTVNGAKAYADDAVSTAVGGLDVNEFSLATESSGVVTIKGIKEVDGEIAVGTDTTKDVVFAKAATTGAAADISVADTGEKINATNVEGALAELADAIATATDAGEVTCETDNPASGDTLKTYSFYQGVLATDDEATKAAKKIVDINIPRDYLVKAAEVKTVETADTPYTGAEVGDKYIDFTVNTKDSAGTATHLYIAVDDLMSAITAAQNATQVQVAISANNEISATLVAGGVGTTELAAKAVTTAKIADDAVTGGQIADDAVGAEHIAIAAHTESQTAGADGIAVSVTTTDGQVSGVTASIAANTYDAHGAAAAVLGASGDAATANTVYGAKAAASAAQTDVDNLETLVGTLPQGATSSTVVDYIEEKVNAGLAWGVF